MDSPIKSQQFTVAQIFSTAWELIKEQISNVFLIAIIVYVPINIGLSFIPLEEMIEKYGMTGFRVTMRIYQIVEALFGVLALMALTYLSEQSLQGNKIDFKTALKKSLSRWGAVLWTSLLAGLIVIGLTFLLIIPGIIWGIYYAFVAYVVAVRDLSGKCALDYSKALVRGRWWRVFGILLLFGILEILVGFGLTFPMQLMAEGFMAELFTDTLVDIIGCFFKILVIIFFLNLDYITAKSDATPKQPQDKFEEDSEDLKLKKDPGYRVIE